MLEFVRVHVLRVLDCLLGALEGGLDGIFVDLLLGDGAFGEDGNLVAVDLGEAAADRKIQGLRALGDAQFAVLDLVSRGMWPGRMPISPSTVGMTTVSMVSE
jgi:hypothetical protein